MSRNVILSGTLDMLHSLYDFDATYAKTLSFHTHEYFILHQANTKHKNWWEVINESGELGYIPSNYVENVTVNPSFYLQFLDNCLDNINRRLRKSPHDSKEMHEILMRLTELRRHIQDLPDIGGGDADDVKYKNSDISKLRTPQSSDSSLITELKTEIEEPIITPIPNTSREAIRKSIENIHEEVAESVEKEKVEEAPPITEQSVYELVELVRINTELSHEMSRVAVMTVCQGLHELLPASVFPHLSTIMSKVQTSLVVDDGQIDQTHDASRLKILFTELTSCKEDSQQRSWMLHEDEDMIKEYLLELISILSNADTAISKHVISSDEYHSIVTLVQYYQMETRWTIRYHLIQAFGVLCSLDKTVVSILLNSVLPGELARDMMSSPRNIPKLNYSSLLLTMIFSMGEPMPITHHEYLGRNFVDFLLNSMEYPPDTDVDEQIPDLFLNVLIAFNLQFSESASNLVLDALETRDVAKTFTEKALLLLNRENDPVRIFDHEPAPPHSVLKLFSDLLSRKSTADLFYTNDIIVLVDIIVRNINDLSPGDIRRAHYLELCRSVIKNTNYDTHRHRADEILKCFTRIFCEESELSKIDQKLVREISHEFPYLFK